ncbi:AraC family two component transcriptional regulator [Roseateles depolymerans]|uniref:AraC family transcriptional regulator n=2 Tax=Roseateles depolymerans TaxID=76731 RepID=A0A0U3L0W7_9BURK|nr:AraC family transcriptional regulator [Roseateles depolymerans]REG15013.1 AraC family two component transcriptional regulator [Roseateles depolymerans]
MQRCEIFTWYLCAGRDVFRPGRQTSTVGAPDNLFPMTETDTAVPSGATAPLILLIDDVPEDLRWLNELLRKEYRMALAHSGQQGLQRAQALRPQLILLDVGLPDMDGFALCRLLKTDPITAAIPVLFLSAHNQPDDRVNGLGLGAVDFISKPFWPEEVLARVRVHLALAAQLQHKDEEEPAGAPTGDPASRNPDGLLVQEAVRYIRAHLAELPPVPELARRIGLHEKRLLALFRDHLGQTVSGFVSEERMRHGARLLSETGMAVQQVALAVGFNNPGNFATAFRTRFGQSPMAYRMAAREGSVQ